LCVVCFPALILFLVFPYFFLVPYARLSWPFCQLLSAHKYIVSYLLAVTHQQCICNSFWLAVATNTARICTFELCSISCSSQNHP